MPPAPRPPAVDARLLKTFEHAFGRLAGPSAVIDAKKLQAVLGLRSEYLAQRVLVAFDLNGDGVIQRDEFIEGVRKLISGTDQEKLMFVFRLHDHDGDGAISMAELHRMIAISLAESEVAEHATQPAEKLAEALFAAADRNHDGRLSFAEFESALTDRAALLRRLTRSEAQWIAPNEDILAWLDGDTKKPRRFAPVLEAGWGPRLVIAVWVAINVGILVHGVARGRNGLPMNELMHAGRAFGRCIDFNGALLLVPVMRRMLTWLRSTFLGRVLPIDEAITFHRIVGHTLVVFGLLHGVALIAAYGLGHPAGSIERLIFATERGLTGSLLVIVITVMWIFALSIVRRSSKFELFYFTHLLYIVWFVLAIAHAPSFLFWAGVPLLGFAIEQVWRLTRRGKESVVVEAHALRSGVTTLEVARPAGFSHGAGDYAFLRVPGIARHEWHPFTISSAPERDALTFHVRSLGNWTSALRRRVEENEAKSEKETLVVYVDGPYGSPSAHIFKSRFAVFIGAGIGVTPFASVLESLVLRANSDHPSRLERAHFFWLNKDQYSFEWFTSLLAELEKQDHKALLDIHLCMTAGRSGATAMALEVAREINFAAGQSDIVTGLRTHTHMGHPDWEEMLGAIQAEHAPAAVDVYFCGPAGLAKQLRAVCMRLQMPFREEKF